MTKNDKSNAKGNEKVAEKLKDMGLMPSEDDVKSTEETEENVADNKMPYALILTFALFISGIIGILLMAGNSEEAEPEKTIVEASMNGNKDARFSRQEEMDKLFAERRKAMQERRQSLSMTNGRPEMRDNKQPAWVAEQRNQMQQQMNQRPVVANQARTQSAVEAPAWVKDRQAMMAQRQKQQAKQQKQFMLQQQEQQQKQMMAYQQWLKSQQRNQPVNMNARPAVRAPAYYYPNTYYPPAPYYGPRY